MDKKAFIIDLPFIELPDKANLPDIKSLYICHFRLRISL